MGYYTEFGYMLNGVLYASDREAIEAANEE